MLEPPAGVRNRIKATVKKTKIHGSLVYPTRSGFLKVTLEIPLNNNHILINFFESFVFIFLYDNGNCLIYSFTKIK